MGDAGAAAGEPLESYRATTESTGVPELSPLGRQASDLSNAHAVVSLLRASTMSSPGRATRQGGGQVDFLVVHAIVQATIR